MNIMGLVVHNVAWAETYLRTKCHLDLSSRLATTDGLKIGRRLCPLFSGGEGGGVGPYLTQCGQGGGLPPYQVAS